MTEAYDEALAVVAAAPGDPPEIAPYTGAPDDFGYLREWIIAHASEFYGVSESVFDTASILSTTLIRDYVHRSLWQLDSPGNIKAIALTSDYLGSNDVGRMFRYPAQGLCGDMALQLWQVYRSLGYETNYLDIINSDISSYSDSHVTTQVYVDELGKFIVQDSTFNYVLTDIEGNLFSFSEARIALLSGEQVLFFGSDNYRSYAAGQLSEPIQSNAHLYNHILTNYFNVVYRWTDADGRTGSWLPSLFRDSAGAHLVSSDQGLTFTDSDEALVALTAALALTSDWQAVAGMLRGSGYYVSGFQVTELDSDWLTVRLQDGSYLSVRLHDLFVMAGSLDQLLLESMSSPSAAAIFSERAVPVLLTVNGALLPGTDLGGARTTLFASPEVTAVQGDAGRDRIFGTDAANYLDGGGGGDYLVGGAGDDTYVVDSLDDLIIEYMGNGYDTILAKMSYSLTGDYDVEVEALSLYDAASTAALNLTGNRLANALTGNAGANRLNGGAGADVMTGLSGDDTYYIDNTGDVVVEVAGEGSDRVITNVSYTLAAGLSVETMTTYGSASTHTIDLTGNELANTLVGNDGANVLNGGAGSDVMWGYAGDDTYHVDNVGDVVVENADEGADTVVTSISYTLAAGVSVEALRLLNAASTDALNLTGNELANSLIGNAGANRLNGGAGADVMSGLSGNDTYFVDSAADQVFEAAGEGSDTIITNVSYTLAAGVSVELMTTYGSATTRTINLTGNELANTLVGNSAANVLNGGDGADALWGYGGDDFLIGGAGDDVMLGGLGADSFVVGQGIDTIRDFTHGQDHVVLQAGQTVADLIQVGANVEALLSDGGRVILSNLLTTQITSEDFVLTPPHSGDFSG